MVPTMSGIQRTFNRDSTNMSPGDGTVYTNLKKPLKIVYSEEHETRNFAIKREHQIKKWSHAKKKSLMSGDLAKLKHLSRKVFKKQ